MVHADYCPWCWAYDFQYDCHGYDFDICICPECENYVIEQADNLDLGLEECRPPWQPDARARRQAQLELAKFHKAIAKKIAEFERGQWDP